MVPPPNQPLVTVKAALSLDGFLDDASPSRRILSSKEDLDAVDALRASYDAILVGAGTVRADDPSLTIRDEAHRRVRSAKGLPEHPAKVVLSASGALDPASRIFKDPTARPLVYVSEAAYKEAAARLGALAQLYPLAPQDSIAALVRDLAQQGIRRLLVEGGAVTIDSFLRSGVVDTLRLAIAPVFIADPGCPRFNADGVAASGKRLTLERVEQLGQTAVLHYRVVV